MQTSLHIARRSGSPKIGDTAPMLSPPLNPDKPKLLIRWAADADSGASLKNERIIRKLTFATVLTL